MLSPERLSPLIGSGGAHASARSACGRVSGSDGARSVDLHLTTSRSDSRRSNKTREPNAGCLGELPFGTVVPAYDPRASWRRPPGCRSGETGKGFCVCLRGQTLRRSAAVLIAVAVGVAGCSSHQSFSRACVEQAFARHGLQLVVPDKFGREVILAPRKGEQFLVLVYKGDGDARRSVKALTSHSIDGRRTRSSRPTMILLPRPGAGSKRRCTR